MYVSMRSMRSASSVRPSAERIQWAKSPALRPSRVWDDGARTYLEFAQANILADLPPLFVTGQDGKAAELVNYHVAGRVLIVERLFDAAELRLGAGKAARRVRIERKAARGEAVQ